MSKEPIATCFEFEDDDPLNPIKFERVLQAKGPALWAIRRGGMCLAKSGRWNWEPRPSSRTDAWLDEHRYTSVQEAVDHYRAKYQIAK
jgi:hypothetical protein